MSIAFVVTQMALALIRVHHPTVNTMEIATTKTPGVEPETYIGDVQDAVKHVIGICDLDVG